MSSLEISAKRQRPADVSQDTNASSLSRTKRLKTDNDDQETQNGNVVVATQTQSSEDSSDWSLDLMFRGNIYNVDPVISTDEKYIFLSRGDSVQIFSLSTRRPIKSFKMKDSSYVTGLKLVPSDSQHLYISTSSNRLIQWDWDTNEEITTKGDFSNVVAYEVVPVKVQDEKERMAYFAVRKKGSRSVIIANTDWLLQNDSVNFFILKIENAISQFRVLLGGQVIVACSRDHLIIGTSKEQGQFKNYEWREFRLPARQVSCLDVREVDSVASKGSKNHTKSIDIAIGDVSGAILIYNDVLSFINRDSAPRDGSKAGLPLLQRFHWHREPVASLRWSRDGNYIISGGKESTIVFWQLDSARKNFLPNLPSSIRSITLSSGGALYAVQLEDGSITILSATEMDAIATIEGLQLPKSLDTLAHSNKSNAAGFLEGNFPALLHSRESEKLLVAIPGGDNSESLSFLQTFNIQTGSHISRQALTRTNVTIMNKGPEGTPILPPNVEYMDLSDNGEWLATVDSWIAPKDDVEAFSTPLTDKQTTQSRSEIFLKFWHWSETQGIWELATRVESPHLNTSGEAVKVLSLKARPHRSEFVTLGTDHVIRIWQPTARYNRSIKSQRPSNAIEHTWKTGSSISLKGQAGYNLPGRAMSFSEDGSILAVSMNNTVHLIDTQKQTVYCSRNVFSIDKIRRIEFQGRYLIAESEQSLAVWDVIEETLQIPEKSAFVNQGTHKYISLAVGSSTDTFAVVAYVSDMSKDKDQPKQQGRESAYGIIIYSTSAMTPLSEHMLDKCPIKLLADPITGGYIVIDVESNLWRLGHRNQKLQAPALTSTVAQHQQASTTFHDIFGRVGQEAESNNVSAQPTSSTLTLHNLGGIFDRAPPFALPPAATLFKDVIDSLVSSS